MAQVINNTRLFFKMTKVTAGVTAVASVVSYCVERFPHTTFVDKYEEIIQTTQLGEGVPLQSNVKKIFYQVLDDLKLSEDERKCYKPFNVVGFDVVNIGIPNREFGARIGIPENFSCTEIQSFDYTKFKIGYNQEPLNMYHPSSDDLIESLVLSKRVKKFAIAREILMSRKKLPLYRSIESPVVIIGIFLLAEFFRIKYYLFNKPKLGFLVYALSSMLGFAVWFQIRDQLNKYAERSVDKELAILGGPEYVLAGREFYEKQLQRNLALRKLLGKVGARKFNRNGDETFLIRDRKTPLSYRKKFFDLFEFETI